MDPTKDQANPSTVVPNNQDVVQSIPPPVGLPSKEAEPFSQDLVSSSEKGPEISAELKEIGRKEVLQTPEPTQDHMQAGIRVSQSTIEPATTPSSSPVPTDPYMTQAQAITEVKKPDKTNSFVWRALTFIRALGKQRMKQKA